MEKLDFAKVQFAVKAHSKVWKKGFRLWEMEGYPKAEPMPPIFTPERDWWTRTIHERVIELNRQREEWSRKTGLFCWHPVLYTALLMVHAGMKGRLHSKRRWDGSHQHKYDVDDPADGLKRGYHILQRDNLHRFIETP